MEWWTLALLFLAGAVAGTLNVIAGGGSFLSLPVLIFFGLPAGVANGTNRVGILLQNAAASWSFRRHGVLDKGALVWAAAPAVPGGVLGAWLALELSDAMFQRILAILMVILTLWSLVSKAESPKDKPPEEAHSVPRERLALVACGFFLAGVYAGFVQAGVGFLILALTSAAGLDLVRGNAVKVLSLFCLTVLALAVFAWQGRVDWGMGLALGLGNLTGGLLGARLTVLKGHAWIRKVVIVMVIFFAVKLWIDA